MRRALKAVTIVIAVLIILVLSLSGFLYYTIRKPWPRTTGTIIVEGLRAPVTIVRDKWGVPHIYASNTHDLFFAQGYVHAQDRFWQMEYWRRIGSGRLSEIFGEATLKIDRFIRTLGWHRVAARELEQLEPEVKAILEAYAKGVNAYLKENKGKLGLEFTILGLIGAKFEPEPWTPYNILTWAKVMAWNLGGNWENEIFRAMVLSRVGSTRLKDIDPPYPPDKPVIVPHPETGSSSHAPETLIPLSQATFESIPWEALEILRMGPGLGSNNWVVSGSRTTTGRPLLANDPHLGIQMPSIWYEIGLHCEPVSEDCPFRVVGASFAGVPGVIIGHNEYIAWGVTNVNPDVQDLYVERINPENPDQYEVDGKWENMQIIWEEIKVRGREEPVRVRVRLTRHGPIINDVAGGTEEAWAYGWQPLAFRWTALEPCTIVKSVLLLNKARNWEEFREALRYWDVPSQNFVYADVNGNIGYQMPGKIPIRKKGDGSIPVPGWNNEYEWVGYVPFDELPRTFNPPEGYVVTANNAVVRPDFPHFITLDWNRGYRAQRIVNLITAKDKLSIEDFKAIQMDSYVLHAEEVIPHLATLSLEDPRLKEALEILRRWDRYATTESVGATIFEAVRLSLLRNIFADELGEKAFLKFLDFESLTMQVLASILAKPHSPWYDNVYTPQTETRDEILLKAFKEAVDELEERLGKDMKKWQWGKVHVAIFQNETLGRSGIKPIENIFNRGPVPVSGSSETVNNNLYHPENPFEVMALPSYRQIIDVGAWDNSLSIHTTGQSGHPYHPHYGDFIMKWARGEYHPMLWSKEQVKHHAEAILTLKPK
ncbi:MAG: penicillin acylase family protein [Anaerolineae bacterium]|nr:penicillin acylase family protein [Anaerolineae bacterium]MDW8102090.1 penicillin acylase family protein [Anaerolineae bacterium]